MTTNTNTSNMYSIAELEYARTAFFFLKSGKFSLDSRCRALEYISSPCKLLIG